MLTEYELAYMGLAANHGDLASSVISQPLQ